MENDLVRIVRDHASKEGNLVIPICAKLEEELSQLSPQEAQEYLNSLGIEETGLTRLIRAAFSTLGLITYITSGEIETRAWPILKGTPPKRPPAKSTPIFKKGLSALKSSPLPT